MRVKITKVSSNHNELRTDSMVGSQKCDPIVGQRYIIFGEPLTEGATVRYISTSPVQEIESLDSGTVKLKTMNSVYLIEKLGDKNND